MPHASHVTELLAALILIYLLAEILYQWWHACCGSRRWGQPPLKETFRHNYLILPARWGGRRRITDCSHIKKARASGVDGNTSPEDLNEVTCKPVYVEKNTRAPERIWILRSMLLGAGSRSGASAGPEPVMIEEEDAPTRAQEEQEVQDQAVRVHVYHGNEIRYRYTVQTGVRWRAVLRFLAQDLRQELDTVSVCHLWGGAIAPDDEVTAPPSGAPRCVGYRIAHLPELNREPGQEEDNIPQRLRSRSRSRRRRRAPSSDDDRTQTRRLIMHWQHGNTMQRLCVSEAELGQDAATVTPADIEAWVRRAHPNLVTPQMRLGLMVGDSPMYGNAMRHLTPIPLSHWRTSSQVYIIPSELMGANPVVQEAEHSEAVQLCLDAVSGRLFKNQVKLLLRGEPSLSRRVLKIAHAPSNIRDLMFAAAQRYRMQVSDMQSLKSSQSKPKQKDDAKPSAASESAWQQVGTRRKKTNGQTGEQSAGKQSEQATVAFELFPEDWTHETMTELKLAKDGIHMPGSQTEAEELAKKLRMARHSVALLSIEPLQQTTRTEQLVFRVRQVSVQAGKSMSRERIMKGYLNNFGPTWVRPKLKVATLSCPVRNDAATTVILLSARKTVVSSQMWDQIQQYGTPREVRLGLTALKTIPSTVVDVFNVQSMADSYAVRLRVLRQDLQAWLIADIPFAIHPLEEATHYKVLWDTTIKTLVEARSRYGEVQGYSGLALTQKGIGARFTPATINQARRGAGLAASELYVLSGAPCHMLESDIQALFKQLAWSALLMTQSRRVRNKVATYKVRAEHPPAQSALRVCVGSELVTMQVTPLSRPEKTVAETKPPVMTTWAQAARHTLGKDVYSSENTVTAEPTGRPGKERKKSVPEDEEMDGSTSEDDEESEPQYDIWQEEEEALDEIPLTDLPYAEVHHETKSAHP